MKSPATGQTSSGKRKWHIASGTLYLSVAVLLIAGLAVLQQSVATPAAPQGDDIGPNNAIRMVKEGRATFRYETFKSEDFWGGMLRLHEAIAGAANGGTGPGLTPTAALSAGLKVDLDALPPSLVKDLRDGKVDLNDPATTLALLQLDAVVGVKGIFNDQRRLTSVGIRCALCHSTVDDAFTAGVGHRLDGWPNRDLNVGAIVAMSPNLQPFVDLLRLADPSIDDATVRTVLNSWGPGKFDAELILDGKAFRPDGKSAATLLPAAFGLAGVNLHTYTGWGSVTHWNAFVSNLEMHGKGTFYDPRLRDTSRFPIAAKAGLWNKRDTPDVVTPKLAALHFYQLSLPAPTPPAGSFNAAAAGRGERIFNAKAQCATCHVPPLFTEPGWNMHTPAEIGIDAFQADRSPDRHYRTTPLKGLFTRLKGGLYHDGRFATLMDVVNHYNSFRGLGLTEPEKNDLVEYLKSL
jgi:hypothetical protein